MVNKSTVPVGSTRVVERALGRADVAVVSNPEFLREGSAIHDFLHPDRIVIGAEDQSAAVKVQSLYLGITAPVIVTDPASAETIKYAANAFLATKISFINAVAAVCEAVGADIKDVALGMGYDTRIGHEFLKPGPGWGGSCFPKDTRAMVRIAEDAGYDFNLLKGVVAVNDEQLHRVAEKIVELAGGSVEGKRIGVWGLTFKARTDDLRESPSLAVIAHLVAQGAEVRAFDPSGPGPLEGIEVVDDPYAAVEGAEVLAVLTEWDEFRWLDIDKVADLMAAKNVVDARNLLDRAALARRGFEYEGIGRQRSSGGLPSDRAPHPALRRHAAHRRRGRGSRARTRSCSSADGSRRSWATSATTSGGSPAAATRGPCRTSSPTWSARTASGPCRSPRRWPASPPGSWRRSIPSRRPPQLVDSSRGTPPADTLAAFRASNAEMLDAVEALDDDGWDAHRRGAPGPRAAAAGRRPRAVGLLGARARHRPPARSPAGGGRAARSLTCLRYAAGARPGVRGRAGRRGGGGAAVLEVTDPDARIVVSAAAEQVRVHEGDAPAGRAGRRAWRRSRCSRCSAGATPAQPVPDGDRVARRRARRRVRPGRGRPEPA